MIRANGEENGKRCCDGLTEVFDQWELDSAGNCLALDNYGYYCLKCGDGTCGRGENKCNCAQDCKAAEGQECADSSDCVIAVDLGGCCACPIVLPKSRLGAEKFVVTKSGKTTRRCFRPSAGMLCVLRAARSAIQSASPGNALMHQSAEIYTANRVKMQKHVRRTVVRGSFEATGSARQVRTRQDTLMTSLRKESSAVTAFSQRARMDRTAPWIAARAGRSGGRIL